ncbi:MFS transporter [Noviherbaspirillum saxi]|uniref:MFS transporter n=1 Tax=Noviherbaspirillum saxi TaxID=2320863 RepID=A0A3A3FKJ5_9BURK|nr:MFS transporter [Noviherbaspirillum saxi]RJF95714.1 MFS transporter [Noviherbaspirillum saxi]
MEYLDAAARPSGSIDNEAKEMRKVIFGSSLGTAFEWYDFFVFGTLAAILGPLFFSKELGETGAFLAGLATYGAGLVLRPFGSLLFGKMGDIAGRKTTFMITMALMGVSTAGVGLLPTYEQAGIIAPILLVILRCLQGLALGGEYGGAATYVAEHAAPGRRGYATGWIQICATVGFFLSLVIVLSCQTALGPEQFKAWGWRIPFLISVGLFGVSMYIRSQLNESPVFMKMKAAGHLTKSPIKDSFGNWENMKVVLLALFGAVAGSGIIWYTGQFYALIFLQKSLKMEFGTAYILVSIALAMATPFFVIFGWLSDVIGRKKIMMFVFLLAAVTYVPIFQGLTHYGNPALERAIATSPVTVASNECSIRAFSGPQTDCEKVKEFLNTASVPHTLVAKSGPGVTTKIGNKVVEGLDVAGLKAAIKSAQYPEKALDSEINKPMVVLLLFILVMYVCMGYGPLAALLVELFPTRIRYSSISMPYHIGTGYFGGFMLYFATLITTSTGDIYAGLYYPIVIAVLSLIVGLFWLPETKDFDVSR